MNADTKNEFDIVNLDNFMKEYLVEFRPFAYFDKHLDCIRVQIVDCSVTERRLSKIFTLLEANHTDIPTTVGFTIKGIRHLFEELELPTSGVMKVTDLVNNIIRVFPHGAVKAVEEFFVSDTKNKNMEIDFSELESEAA